MAGAPLARSYTTFSRSAMNRKRLWQRFGRISVSDESHCGHGMSVGARRALQHALRPGERRSPGRPDNGVPSPEDTRSCRRQAPVAGCAPFLTGADAAMDQPARRRPRNGFPAARKTARRFLYDDPQRIWNRPEPDALVLAHVLAVDLERDRPGRPQGQFGLVMQGQDAATA
jgi:hypothetical protein